MNIKKDEIYLLKNGNIIIIQNITKDNFLIKMKVIDTENKEYTETYSSYENLMEYIDTRLEHIEGS